MLYITYCTVNIVETETTKKILKLNGSTFQPDLFFSVLTLPVSWISVSWCFKNVS
jgi:Mg/Co/Ni transporter MgtE